jgi:hypothetical protein
MLEIMNVSTTKERLQRLITRCSGHLVSTLATTAALIMQAVEKILMTSPMPSLLHQSTKGSALPHRKST